MHFIFAPLNKVKVDPDTGKIPSMVTQTLLES